MNGKLILLKGDMLNVDSFGNMYIRVDEAGIASVKEYHAEYLAAKKINDEKEQEGLYRPFSEDGVVRLRRGNILPAGIQSLEVYIKVKQFHFQGKRGYTFDIFLLKAAVLGQQSLLLAY